MSDIAKRGCNIGYLLDEAIVTLLAGIRVSFSKETEHGEKKENTFGNDGLLLTVSDRRSELI